MSGNCKAFEDLICRLPDGDLTDGESAALREHLSGCAECRSLLRAMEAATRDMDDLVDAPGSLASGVMDRIRAEEDLPDIPTSKRLDATRRINSARKRRRRGVGVVVGLAAVFALVIGGGGYIASRLLGAVDASGAAVEQSAVMEMTAADFAEDSGMPQPAPAAGTAPEAAEAEEAPAEEALFSDSAAAREAGYPDYTWEHPAYVPEGREEEFEALVTNIGWSGDIPDAKWQVFCAVEYNGVIYEFLTDPEEQYLLWRDAAESAGHFHSPGTVAQLWDILGA